MSHTPFVFMISVLFLNFIENDYDYTFKSKKSVLSYSFELKGDSTFMIGRVIEKKTQDPMFNVNILVVKHSIGTVPNVNGEFKIYLPERNGTILFDKVGHTRFEMNYQISSKTIMNQKEQNQETSHH